MRKLMLFASLAMAATALAVPSSASAIWTHNHSDIPTGTNPQIHSVGSLVYTAQVGGITCQDLTTTTQLTGGTTTLHVQQFTLNTASCKTTGGLSSCTLTALTADTLPYTGHVSATVIKLQNAKFQTKFTGLFCPPKLQFQTSTQHPLILQPKETGSVGGHATITGFTIGGQPLLIEASSTAQFQGTHTLTASNTHTYGHT